jgi:hypothetical protein
MSSAVETSFTASNSCNERFLDCARNDKGGSIATGMLLPVWATRPIWSRPINWSARQSLAPPASCRGALPRRYLFSAEGRSQFQSAAERTRPGEYGAVSPGTSIKALALKARFTFVCHACRPACMAMQPRVSCVFSAGPQYIDSLGRCLQATNDIAPLARNHPLSHPRALFFAILFP